MHQEAFDEGAHLVLRVPSLSILGPSPPVAASAKKCPACGAGHSCSAAVAPDPGLRGWANHNDSPSVQGDSVKAAGPFGGAVGKTCAVANGTRYAPGRRKAA